MTQDLLLLVRQALADLDDRRGSVTAAARKAVRIARLRRDYSNLYWLSRELRNFTDQRAKYSIYYEVAPHLTREALESVHESSTESCIWRRTSQHIEGEGTPPGEEGVLMFGLGELEARRENLVRGIEDLKTPATLEGHQYMELELQQGSTRAKLHRSLTEWEAILSRISGAIFDHLSRVEAQLAHGQVNSDLFQQNRRYVEARLEQSAPAALEQLRAAEARLIEGSAEALSHALTSCRRLLESLADLLYPPSDEEVVGSDGKKRILDKTKYVSRLKQYVSENVPNSASRRLIGPEVEELWRRIARLNEISSKGVHAEVTVAEANQCVLQTYFLTGDLFRIADGSSAATVEESELDLLYPDPPNPGDRANG